MKRRFWMALLLALLAGPAWADESDGGDEEAEVPEETIVVTADRAGRAAVDTPAAISAVPAEAIAERAAADVVELLPLVPGVDAQSMGPGGYGQNVSIRGSSDFKPGGFGNRVLVLLDGRPVNSPDTHGVDWAALPPLDLERIEVLRGPASALYGSSALGGVIQLFSRKPGRGGDVQIGQGFACREANLTRLAAGAGEVSSNWAVRLSGWLQDYRGLCPPGEDAFRFNSDTFRQGLKLVGEGQPGAAHKLQAEVSWHGSEGGNPGFLGSSLPSRSRRFERRTLSGGLRWGFQPEAKSLLLETGLSYSHLDASVADPDGGNRNDYSTDRLSLSSVLSLVLAEHFVGTAGVEAELQSAEGDVYQLGPGQVQVLTGSTFAQGQMEFLDLLELTAGLRLDGFAYSSGQQFGALSPKLRLALRPDKHTIVWAAVNRGFRAPSIGELYLKYESTFGLIFLGNPDLVPEALWAFELGARRVLWGERIVLEAIGYLNLGEDTIEFEYRSFPVSARNIEGSRIAGAELSMVLRPFKSLTLEGSFNWLHARSLPDEGELLYRPPWRGRLGIRLEAGFVFLSGNLAFVGPRLYDDFLAQSPEPPRLTLEPYLQLDLSAGARLASGLRVVLAVRNVLDSDYRVIQRYPPPGREWAVDLRLPFDWPRSG